MADWLAVLIKLGFAEICVASGTLLWGSKDAAKAELHLLHEKGKTYCIYAGNTAEGGVAVCMFKKCIKTFYNIVRVLSLCKSYWAAMNKIFIYARPCENKMTWAFSFYLAAKYSCSRLSCSAVFLLFKIWKKPANNSPIFLSAFSDLLGPDPTSSKKKAELKKSRKLRVSKFVGRPVAANFGRKTFTGNRTDTNWSSTTFKGKISVFIVTGA